MDHRMRNKPYAFTPSPKSLGMKLWFRERQRNKSVANLETIGTNQLEGECPSSFSGYTRTQALPSNLC